MSDAAQRIDRLPLTFRWEAAHPLPTRVLRPLDPLPRLAPVLAGPTWIPTGPMDQPFDFGGHLRRLLEDIVSRVPDLAHVDVSKVLIGMTRARHNGIHGLQARVTPLRFARGELHRVRRKVVYQVQRYFHGEREFLYLLEFCLPRFLNQEFDSKLVTIFHELYHISPECDGDLRRHGGRCRIHTHSKKNYDRHMAVLAREYLSTRPDSTLYDFLRLNYIQLCHRHGGVAGVVVPRPKVIPLMWAAREG